MFIIDCDGIVLCGTGRDNKACIHSWVILYIICRIDDRSSFKAKIDTSALLAASFNQRLNDHVTMTACAEVDVSDWCADSHKFGFGLSFDQ